MTCQFARRRRIRAIVFAVVMALPAVVPAAGGDGALRLAHLPLARTAAAVPPEVQPAAYQLPAPAAEGYWVVSSRRSAQHPLDRVPWGLDYFQAVPNGPLFWSSADSLRAGLTPGVPVCIFVHGSFVDWPEHLEEAAQANRWVREATAGCPLHVVFFSWPSDRPYTFCFPVDVTARGARAEFNGFHVAHLMSLLPEQSPVCLIGHSHGARTVLSAAHLAGGGTVRDLAFTGNVGATRRMRLALAAAAVDHDWVNPDARYGCALCRSEAAVNLKNRCDGPLFFYPLARPFARPALATVGWTDGDRERMGWLSQRAMEIDVTPLLGRAHLWPDYFTRPEIGSVLGPFITFADAATVMPAPPAMPPDSGFAAPEGPVVGPAFVQP
jgi:hypothetical protein